MKKQLDQNVQFSFGLTGHAESLNLMEQDSEFAEKKYDVEIKVDNLNS